MTLAAWAWLLIVLPVVGWVSTVVLAWNAHQLRERALTDRTIAGVILSTIATVFAFLSIAYLLNVRLPPDAFTAALIAIALLANVPQFVWVLSLLTGRFR